MENIRDKKEFKALDSYMQAWVLDTVEALDNGKGLSIEFFSDGSGVRFTVVSPACNCRIARSFSMEVAALILAGHRLASHDIPNCMY